MEEDVQICEGCVAKFARLESLQNEISLLENKVEDILSQLRKTIRDRHGLSSQPEPAATTSLTCSDVDDEDRVEYNYPLTSTLMMPETADDADEEVDFEVKPVILEEEFQVEDEEVEVEDPLLQPLLDDNNGDDPLGGIEAICEEHEPMNNSDHGGHHQPGPKKSKRFKAQMTRVIDAILCNVDNVDGDDNGTDEYSPINESDTHSDTTTNDELQLDSDTRNKRYKPKRGRMPSDSLPKVQKLDDNRISGDVEMDTKTKSDIGSDISEKAEKTKKGRCKSITVCEICFKQRPPYSSQRNFTDHRKYCRKKKKSRETMEA